MNERPRFAMVEERDGAALEALLAREQGELKARLEEAERALAIATAERNTVKAKLDAVETLLGKRPTISGTSHTPSFMDQIAAQMKDGIPRTPAELRAAMIAGGFDPTRVATNRGRFYSLITRLVEKGILIKDPADGRYRYIK